MKRGSASLRRLAGPLGDSEGLVGGLRCAGQLDSLLPPACLEPECHCPESAHPGIKARASACRVNGHSSQPSLCPGPRALPSTSGGRMASDPPGRRALQTPDSGGWVHPACGLSFQPCPPRPPSAPPHETVGEPLGPSLNLEWMARKHPCLMDYGNRKAETNTSRKRGSGRNTQMGWHCC